MLGSILNEALEVICVNERLEPHVAKICFKVLLD